MRSATASDHRVPRGDEAAADATLARAVARGDASALEQLYRRHGAACYGLARRIVVDTELAQDVVQEVFMALWHRTAHDADRGTVGSWLLTITHNKAVDVVRREQRRRTGRLPLDEAADVVSLDPGPAEATWTSLRGENVRAALAELPVPQREVLLLAYYGGYTQREIAAMTGLPIGTVKSRTVAGMRTLSARLGTSSRDVPEKETP